MKRTSYRPLPIPLTTDRAKTTWFWTVQVIIIENQHPQSRIPKSLLHRRYDTRPTTAVVGRKRCQRRGVSQAAVTPGTGQHNCMKAGKSQRGRARRSTVCNVIPSRCGNNARSVVFINRRQLPMPIETTAPGQTSVRLYCRQLATLSQAISPVVMR